MKRHFLSTDLFDTNDLKMTLCTTIFKVPHISVKLLSASYNFQTVSLQGQPCSSYSPLQDRCPNDLKQYKIKGTMYMCYVCLWVPNFTSALQRAVFQLQVISRQPHQLIPKWHWLNAAGSRYPLLSGFSYSQISVHLSRHPAIFPLYAILKQLH